MEQITGNNLIFHDLETLYSYMREMVKENGLVPVDHSRFLHTHENASPSLVSCIPLTRETNKGAKTETFMVFIQWLDPPTSEYHGILDNASAPADPRWIPLSRPLPSYSSSVENLKNASGFFAAQALFENKVHYSKFRGKYFTIEDGKKQFFPPSEVSKYVWKDQPTFAKGASIALANQTEMISQHLKAFHRTNDVTSVDGE